ncbi:MAG: protein kinase [Kofleriaceae bacterium]|nr:protein kinase [Kofleriaceae bacterium]
MGGVKQDADGVKTTPLTGDATARTVEKSLPEEELSVDTLLAGRYRIIRFVARGGMGAVYEAVDTELRTKLAVKVLRDYRDEAAMERVRREVQLARRVTNENVCRIFDLAHTELANGRRITFITMELLEGVTLQARLRTQGPLPAETALPIALDILAGLEACHRAGVIHRDLKAENILVVGREDRDRAFLTDFGIANTAAVERDSSVTRDGSIVGSPAFLAPEQIDGERASVRTDVYAVGILLWELVVGPWPLRRLATLEIMRELAKPERPPGPVPVSTPSPWREVIERCLGPAEERYESIDALRLELAPDGRPLRRSDPALVAQVTPPGALVGPTATGVTATSPKRHVARVLLAVGGLALGIGTVVAAAKLLQRKPETAHVAHSAPPPSAAREGAAAGERALLALDFARAREEARTLAASDPAAATYLRAQIEVALGRWDAALEATVEIPKLVAAVPRTVQLSSSLIEKRRSGDLAGALQISEALYKLAKDTPTVAFDHATLLGELAKTKEALEVLDAIDPAGDDTVAARLHLARAQRMFVLSSPEHAAIEEETTRAIELAKRIAAPSLESRALTLRGSARLFQGKPDLARQDLDAALTLAEREHDQRGLALLYRIMGVFAYNSESDYEKTLAWADKSIAAATEIRDDVLLSLAQNLRGAALKEFGRIEESLLANKASEAAAVRALREDIANTRPRPNLAAVYDDLGYIKEAIAVLEDLDVKRGPDRTGLSELTLFTLYLDKADPDEAGRHAITADRLFTTTDNQTYVGDLSATRAKRAHLFGDEALFRAEMARAEAALAVEGSGLDSPQLVFVKALALADQPPAEALPQLQRILASKLVVGSTRAYVQMVTARKLLAMGKRTDAIAMRDAVTADKLNAPFLRATTEIELFGAELASTPVERATAAKRLERHRALLEAHDHVLDVLRVSLGEATLALSAGDKAKAKALAKIVHTKAAAVGYKRIALAAKQLLDAR